MPSLDFRFHFVGHATAIVEYADLKIVLDPHFLNTHASGLAGYFPKRTVSIGNLLNLDAVFISHVHRDHFDIQTLNLIRRNTPIFCPNDPRLNTALARLGFHDVLNVRDWTKLRIDNHLDVLWTPSEYHVPEHGIAFRVGSTVFWNMVDTVLEGGEVVRRVRQELNECPISVCLAPLLPLQETAITDAQVPALDTAFMSETLRILDAEGVRYICPFADGHLSVGAASWLNAYKFPMLPDLVVAFARRRARKSHILETRPGDIIAVDLNGDITHQKARSEYVHELSMPDPRIFDAAAPILAVASSELCSDKTKGTALKDAFVKSAKNGWFDEIRNLAQRIAPTPLLPAVYRFRTINELGQPVERLTCTVDHQGTVSRAKSAANPDFDVVIASSDFDLLVRGRASYSALYLNGRIRQMLYGPIDQTVCILEQTWHRPAPHHRYGMLSGILLFNRLVGGGGTGALKQLEIEVDAVKQGNMTAILGSRFQFGTKIKHTEKEESETECAIFDKVECYFGSLADGASQFRLSGVVNAQTQFYLGSMIDPLWSDAECRSLEGILLPLNLLDAQPHLGGGVRFPCAAYRRLLDNIVVSGIQKWSILYNLPKGLSIPNWRQFSLFPFSFSRLRKDLGSLGWKGQIKILGDARNAREFPWWLGLPPLEDCTAADIFNFFVEEFGRQVSGLKFSINKPDSSNLANRPILNTLLEARVRASWLLPDKMLFSENHSTSQCDLSKARSVLARVKTSVESNPAERPVLRH
jgi:hypothetical protein